MEMTEALVQDALLRKLQCRTATSYDVIERYSGRAYEHAREIADRLRK